MSDPGGDASGRRRREENSLAYVVEARIPFDDLRDVASQIAGLLVLAGSGSRLANADHPMLLAASERWQAATEAIRGLSPGQQGSHHHRHLLLCAERLGEVLETMRSTGAWTGAIGHPLGLLKAAWQEIVHASRALPGFQTIDLSQSCCAAHATARRNFVAS